MYLRVEQLTYRSLDLPQRPSVSTSHSPWKLFVFPLLRSIIFSLDRARHPFNLTFGTRDQRLFLELPRRLTSRWLTIQPLERERLLKIPQSLEGRKEVNPDSFEENLLRRTSVYSSFSWQIIDALMILLKASKVLQIYNRADRYVCVPHPANRTRKGFSERLG